MPLLCVGGKGEALHSLGIDDTKRRVNHTGHWEMR
jgi:hypothetical protein